MKIKTLTTFLFLFFIFSSFCYAKIEYIAVQSIGTYEIAVPFIPYLAYHSEHEFDIHVYNESGFVQSAPDVACYFHLYNSSGAHTVLEEMVFDSDNLDYSLKVDGEVLNEKRIYATIIICNNTQKSGYVAFDFQVTEDGNEPVRKDWFNLLVYTVLFLLILTCLLFAHIFNRREHQMSPIFFGSLATAFSAIGVSMLSSGFKLVEGVVFFLDVNYYFLILLLGIMIYSIAAGVSLYKDIKPKTEKEEYYDR